MWNWAVTPCQANRLDAEIVGEAKAPHQQDGARYAVVLPAASGRDDRRRDTGRPAKTFEPVRDRDVFHQRQIGKAANGPKRLTADEDRLIAGGDATKPRAPINHA